MEAGKELDVLVAEKLMGWYWQNPFSLYPHIRTFVPPIGDMRRHWAGEWEDGIPHWLPKYSTNITDAWEVIEKAKEWGGMTIYALSDHTRVDTYSKNGVTEIIVREKEAPYAICLAALKAIGHQV